MPRKTTSKSEVADQTTGPILLDTHVLVWLAEGNPRLKAPVLTFVKGGYESGGLCLSMISAWEIGLLVSKKRLDVGRAPLTWLYDVVQNFRISLIDITAEIAINSSNLPPPLHGDPADRIIIATAIAYGATIVSADTSILNYGKQGHVAAFSC